MTNFEQILYYSNFNKYAEVSLASQVSDLFPALGSQELGLK